MAGGLVQARWCAHTAARGLAASIPVVTPDPMPAYAAGLSLDALRRLIQPWLEFFDHTHVKVPLFTRTAVLARRHTLLANLRRFQYNYLVVFCALGFFELFSLAWLLAVLVFTVVAIYGIRSMRSPQLKFSLGSGRHVRIASRHLYTAVGVVSGSVLALMAPWKTLMWLMGVNGGLIVSHAVLLDKPVEVAFNEV